MDTDCLFFPVALSAAPPQFLDLGFLGNAQKLFSVVPISTYRLIIADEQILNTRLRLTKQLALMTESEPGFPLEVRASGIWF